MGSTGDGPIVNTARALWHRIETLHAVTYFAPESRDAARHAGLSGFWMGYFGFRAAPLGDVDAATVIHAFDNFAPTMVERSIPEAWQRASPEKLISVRAHAAAIALRRLAPGIEETAAEVNPLLERIVEESGRDELPMFRANAVLPTEADSVARCWQLSTALREHRGDSHIRALRAVGIDGCESHVLHATARDLPIELLRDNRGWTDDEWDLAAARLVDRGLLDVTGLSRAGARLRAEIEDRTDRRARDPIDAALGGREQRRLLDVLTAPAHAVAGSGTIPFPNPMGLPDPR